MIVFTVIEESNRFLMIKEASRKWKGKWSFPGGRVEKAETIEAAAQRETQEESGFTVVIHGILHINFFKGIVGWGRIHIYLAAGLAGGSMKKTADRHSLLAAWKTAKEIRELDIRDPIMVRIIEDYRNIEVLPLEHFKEI